MVWDVMNRLVTEHALLVMVMEGDDPGFSSGYYWPRTRDVLLKEKFFRDMLKSFEATFEIHYGVVSCKMFDRASNEAECTGDYRMIISINAGKKMRFTDGKRESTLTLPHGAVLVLSNTAEKLVEKDLGSLDAFYDQGPDDRENRIPKTDSNEPVNAYFLMLDVSMKG